MTFNVVELIQDEGSDCAFDQPCRFGHRVDGHAVYCHNDNWLDSPRKCRQTWYSNGKVKDEDCPGFQPNPDFKGVLQPTPTNEPLCNQCRGQRFMAAGEDKTETCPRCQGEGSEPQAMRLTRYQQDTLECGALHNNGLRYVRIAETKEQAESVFPLVEHSLVHLHSLSMTDAGATVFLLTLTGKGAAIMRANWATQSASDQLKWRRPKDQDGRA